MRVSVVICEGSLDRYDECARAADSVLDQTHEEIELVLVANGSRRVCERFEAEYGDRDDVRIDCLDERRGQLESRNAGAELATGEVVAFLGDDVAASERWAASLVRTYEEQAAVAVTGPVRPEWTAGEPWFLPRELSWLVGATGPDDTDDSAADRWMAAGSNVSFRRDQFLDAGGFDTALDGPRGADPVRRGVAELWTRLRTEDGRDVLDDSTATVTRVLSSGAGRPTRLLGRAFWQGCSQRAAANSTETAGAGRSFLGPLVGQWLPRRLSSLVSTPSVESATRLFALFLFAAVYAAGYGYGWLKYGGTRVQIRSGTDDVRYRVLWLRPSRGDNISVRRERISERLADRGVAVDIVDVTGPEIVPAIFDAVTSDYDAIFGNVRLGLYLGYPLARLTGRPFVGTVSDPISDIEGLPGPLFEALRRYEWFALSRADAATFTYKKTFEEARDRGIDGWNLPNAVDYEMFAEPDRAVVDRASKIMADEGVDLDSNVAIYIGGFHEKHYKISQIIGAAKRRPEWEFVFVGEGEERARVETAAREQENVHYPGAFDYDLMPGFLAHATVGFCFKDAEQPLKVAEYGAAGLVVFAQRGELSERFDDDEVCFVEPTSEGIADGLATLGADPQLVDRYGSEMRRHAKAVSWDEIAAEYDEILEQILRN